MVIKTAEHNKDHSVLLCTYPNRVAMAAAAKQLSLGYDQQESIITEKLCDILQLTSLSEIGGIAGANYQKDSLDGVDYHQCKELINTLCTVKQRNDELRLQNQGVFGITLESQTTYFVKELCSLFGAKDLGSIGGTMGARNEVSCFVGAVRNRARHLINTVEHLKATTIATEAAKHKCTVNVTKESITSDSDAIVFDSDGVCMICLDALNDDGSENALSGPKILTCGHAFHDKCIMQWLQTKSTCPLCRQKCSISVSQVTLSNILQLRLRPHNGSSRVSAPSFLRQMRGGSVA